MKKLITIVLVLSLVFTLFMPFTANAANLYSPADSTADEADEYVTDPEVAANKLHELKVMNGVGTKADGTPDFALDKTVTRAEGMTVLVNLLGVTQDELAKAGTHPFTDVPDWANSYIAYAYNNHLTGGTSATTFGTNDTMSVTQYLSFVLQALGYTIGTEFQWDKAWELSDTIGLTRGEYSDSTAEFTRGGLALISCNALTCKMKDSDKTLQENISNAPESSDAPAVGIDFDGAEVFEAALNKGYNVNDRIVQFVAKEIQTSSTNSYTVCAGEKLKFVFESELKIGVGDSVVTKVSFTWKDEKTGMKTIHCDKIDNACATSNTITNEDIEEINNPQSLEIVRFTSRKDSNTVSYCAVVQNPNKKLIASFPTLTCTVKDENDSIVATDDAVSGYILPGDTVTVCRSVSILPEDAKLSLYAHCDADCKYLLPQDSGYKIHTSDYNFRNLSIRGTNQKIATGEISCNFSASLTDISVIFIKDKRIVYFKHTYIFSLKAGEWEAFQLALGSNIPDYDEAVITASISLG